MFAEDPGANKNSRDKFQQVLITLICCLNMLWTMLPTEGIRITLMVNWETV